MFPDRLQRLVQLLGRLPGVGEKTAQRYALALVTGEPSRARELGRALLELHDWVRPCARCNHMAELAPASAAQGAAATPSSDGPALCSICSDPKRDPSMLCVVARVQDLLAIERSGVMRGRYFVLGKLLSPLDGVGREELGIDRLRALVTDPGAPVTEVLVATPPSVDGEATAFLLARELGALGANVTRIASGVPHGGDLEFADQITLGRAIEHRRRFS